MALRPPISLSGYDLERSSDDELNVSFRGFLLPCPIKNIEFRQRIFTLQLYRKSQNPANCQDILNKPVDFLVEWNMKWIGISDGWRKTNRKIENEVRSCVLEIMERGDVIVSG